MNYLRPFLDSFRERATSVRDYISTLVFGEPSISSDEDHRLLVTDSDSDEEFHDAVGGSRKLSLLYLLIWYNIKQFTMSILNHSDEYRVDRERGFDHGCRRREYYIPESLWFKKVVANMENYNEESFKWSVARSLNPVEKNPQWITRDLRRQTEQYNWEGISFPTPLSQIETFEKNNNVLVNVFGWNMITECAFPIRIPCGKHESRALLILIDEAKGHYVVIKSMQGLFRRQTGRNGRMFYCNNCLVIFSSDNALQKHVVCCERLDYSFFGTKLNKKSKTIARPNSGMVNGRAINNMKCSDEESFRWAVTRALNPVGKSSQRVTKILKEQSRQYNWNDISFPTPLEQVKTFEKNNNVLVNVFKFDKERDCVYPISVSPGEYDGRALLVFVDNRYAVVKTISRLLGGQVAKGKARCKRFHCNNCLNSFTCEDRFNKHITSFCSSTK